MESYIVRIYRRDRNQPGSISGMVEIVGEGESAFSGYEGLREILEKGVVVATQKEGRADRARCRTKIPKSTRRG